MTLQVNTTMHEQLNIDYGDYGEVGNQLSIMDWLNQNDEESILIQYMQETADSYENQDIIAMLEDQIGILADELADTMEIEDGEG